MHCFAPIVQMIGDKVLANRWEKYGKCWSCAASLSSISTVDSYYLAGSAVKKIRDVKFESVGRSARMGLKNKVCGVVAVLVCRCV